MCEWISIILAEMFPRKQAIKRCFVSHLTQLVPKTIEIGSCMSKLQRAKRVNFSETSLDEEDEVGVPLLELGVDHSVGEALAADPDAFEHTVTLQLM